MIVDSAIFLRPPVVPQKTPDDDPIATVERDAQDKLYPFEAMKLKVGDRLQLQLPELLSRERAMVRLIGYVANLSLLVTMPRETNGLRFGLLENDTVVARIFTSQNAFGFSATVVKIIKIPFEYLHLSFPNEVKGVVIRKAPRVRTRIICSVVGAHADANGVPGMLVNLSANGAQLDTRQALAKKGETLRATFRINLHGVETLLTINAIVRAQFSDEPTGQGNASYAHHGLEFTGLQPNDCMLLQSLIYQQMVEQPNSVL